jgi:preprotein translocase subunit SecA
MVSSALESAQRKVESRNFDIRKHVLQYDDINNQQREIIYKERNAVLDGEDVRENITSMVSAIAENMVKTYIPENAHAEALNLTGLREYFETEFGELLDGELEYEPEKIRAKSFNKNIIKNEIVNLASERYERREEIFGARMREIERIILLRVVDEKWMDHIDNMEQLKQGIHLRGYAQRDPIVEYRFEGMNMFDEMIESIKEDTVKYLFHAQLREQIVRHAAPIPGEIVKTERIAGNNGGESTSGSEGGGSGNRGGFGPGRGGGANSGGANGGGGNFERGAGIGGREGGSGGNFGHGSRGGEGNRNGGSSSRGAGFFGEYGGEKASEGKDSHKNKPGRNDPCPCGSGKKFKHCCIDKY